MSDGGRLNSALRILSEQRHTVQTNPGVCFIDSEPHVPIDGRLRSASEITAAVTLPDEVWRYDVHGQRGELHIFFQRGDIAYKVHHDRVKSGQLRCVPRSESVLEFVQRITKKMGGTNLRQAK